MKYWNGNEYVGLWIILVWRQKCFPYIVFVTKNHKIWSNKQIPLTIKIKIPHFIHRSGRFEGHSSVFIFIVFKSRDHPLHAWIDTHSSTCPITTKKSSAVRVTLHPYTPFCIWTLYYYPKCNRCYRLRTHFDRNTMPSKSHYGLLHFRSGFCVPSSMVLSFFH